MAWQSTERTPLLPRMRMQWTDSGIMASFNGLELDGPRNHHHITQQCETNNCTKYADGAIFLHIWITRDRGWSSISSKWKENEKMHLLEYCF